MVCQLSKGFCFWLVVNTQLVKRPGYLGAAERIIKGNISMLSDNHLFFSSGREAGRQARRKTALLRRRRNSRRKWRRIAKKLRCKKTKQTSFGNVKGIKVKHSFV